MKIIQTVRYAHFYSFTRWDGDCLRWTGYVNENGYACSYRDPETGRNALAHRYIYEKEVGPIPEGLAIDHVYEAGCRFRDCVLITHLEPVTAQENARRRSLAQTHCKNGHEFTPENTAIFGKSQKHRACKTCRREAQRRYRARQKDAA